MGRSTFKNVLTIGAIQIKKDQGFSLLECMLSNMLLMIVLTVLLQIFMQFYSACTSLQEEIFKIEEARMVTAFLEEEIQKASCIEISMRENIKTSKQDDMLLAYLVGLTLKESALSTEKVLVLHVEESETPFLRDSMYYQGVAVTQSKHYAFIELNKQEKIIHITFVLSEINPIKVKKSIYLKEKYII